jgi:twitching motility protein PilT
MTKLYRDEELDRMVRELNEGRQALPDDALSSLEPEHDLAIEGDAAPTRTGPLADDDGLTRLLTSVVRQAATDLLLVPPSPPVLRVNGRLALADAAPLDDEQVRALLAPHLGPRRWRTLDEHGAVDFSLRLARSTAAGAWRFRVNVHRQRGALAAALRVLPHDIPTLSSLNLPAGLAELARPTRGLVLISGPTGSGKSSTLAALVGEINRTRTAHVVTIEDPVEYEHANVHSVIEQIEIGVDAPSFAAALKASLRQDPDVILVGEMRDLETISTALTAAETGHLVLSTLHTSDVVQAIHRIVDVFPAGQQDQIRQQLAISLHAIVCQQLIPRIDDSGRLPAVEVLIATNAIRHHLRSQRSQHLHNEVVLGRKLGMITLEESLARLVKAGTIAPEEAEIRASHQDELASLLHS